MSRNLTPFRATIVLDNLIHQGAMPVTIGIFISPGTLPATPGDPSARPRSNRSFGYDTPSDQYARFLLEEILPEVGKDLKLTSNPELRGVGGISSGGICAWTVAWERPDSFRRVLSHVGSFTNIRGGHNGKQGGATMPDALRWLWRDWKDQTP